MFTGTANERVIHLECGPGLLFDSKINSCNYNNLVTCPSKKPTTEPTTLFKAIMTSPQTTLKTTTEKLTIKLTTTTASSTVKCPTGKYNYNCQ